MTKLTLQTSLQHEQNPNPLAVASTPVKLTEDMTSADVLNAIETSSIPNVAALFAAIVKHPSLPENKSVDKEAGTAMLLYKMYQSFLSGKSALVSCHRYPCGDGTDDHCVVVRFTPPKG